MEFESDFAVLTVVPEAFELALELLGEPNWQRRENQDWPVWEIEVADGGRARVVATKAPDRSNVPACETASLLLETWQPRHLLLADIGGGFQGRDDLDVGDLVVAREVEYYSFYKETDDGDQMRRYPVAPPTPATRKALEVLSHRHPNWTDTIGVQRPASTTRAPKILVGQIVCGEQLLSDPDSDTVEDLTNRYTEALAVDMESIGVARAVFAAQQRKAFVEFCVLRGISDCIGETTRDNQATRDETKPYAAAVALAAAYTFIHTEPSADSVLNEETGTPDTAQATVPDHVDSYLEEVQAVLAAESPARGSSFRLTLRSTRARIEGSALPEEGAPVERGEVLDLVMADRLIVMAGKSGTGKSVLLDTVARQLAAGDDLLVVRIDLKTGWSQTWGDSLADSPLGERLTESMDALLSASSPRVSVGQLEALARSRKVLLLVDALNEVPPAVAKKIRPMLSQYTRRFGNVRVLATDRSIDADYAELRWSALELPELDDGEVRHVIDSRYAEGTFDRLPAGRREILRIPFFLDRAIRDDTTIEFTSRAEAVEKFLRDGGLDSDDLDAAGEVALSVLLRGETTLQEVDEHRLEESGTIGKLREGGFMSGGVGGSVFEHQLIHQCLAGRRLAGEPDRWTPDTMDALTSFGASTDGLGMTIAAIEDGRERDRFLRIVYDWNWYSAVVTLSEAQAGERPVSDAMEQAVLAMVAEKRFDRVRGTREQVESLLAKVDCTTGDTLGSLSATELYEYVEELDHPDVDWWTQWKRTFLRFEGAELLSEQTIGELASEMPLIGWMIANSLRRVEASAEASALVRMVYRSHPGASPHPRTTRWRVLHALGAWPMRENAELLVEGLGDEHVWCSYGATRSAVEMAARTSDHELRDWIIERLSEQWPNLRAEPLRQLARASRYSDVDPGWPAAIRPLIEAVRDAQVEEERVRWDRRLAEFDSYAADLAAET